MHIVLTRLKRHFIRGPFCAFRRRGSSFSVAEKTVEAMTKRIGTFVTAKDITMLERPHQDAPF